MTMTTYRNALSTIYKELASTAQLKSEKGIHAGLWLEKYIADQDKGNPDNRRNLVERVSTLPLSATYDAFYKRWVEMLADYSAQTRKAKVKGRMVIGLGDEGVLETSITLHHTYGVPYIPGSALKGLVASYARQRLGTDWEKGGAAYKVLFGDTDDAGYITFFDALYVVPETGHHGQVHPDVITVHHPKYYQGQNDAPADWDSPIPIPFLSATGSYLVALAAPGIEDAQEGKRWIETTFDILGKALETLGIGAKTSSGYGRMELKSPPVDLDLQKAERLKRETEGMKIGDVASQIHGYYEQWLQIKSIEGRTMLARAIIDKVRQAGREKKSVEKSWYKELLTFLGEIQG